IFAFDYPDGRASLSPYPEGRTVREFPDTLTPVYVDVVARHGSRYPASSFHTTMMKRALEQADSIGTITALGRRLLAEVNRVASASEGR
ncbi:hypothetical protein RFX70_11965, partial [Acinetobacter baumannii]|nr:hypothetical protein [Acinetobacter baumannii]